MPSETDVANHALTLVGGATITGLSDGSTNANKVSAIYEEVRDALLRKHPWNFATKRVQLARSSTNPAFEFDYAYVLPSDWLKTVSVHDNDAGHGSVLYRMEQVAGQRVIVSSSDQIWLRYVSKVTDPNLMTADFRQAFQIALARDLAIPVASSNTMRDQYKDEAKTSLASAKSNDAMGGFPELRPRGSWATSRAGYRRDDFLND